MLSTLLYVYCGLTGLVVLFWWVVWGMARLCDNPRESIPSLVMDLILGTVGIAVCWPLLLGYVIYRKVSA